MRKSRAAGVLFVAAVGGLVAGVATTRFSHQTAATAAALPTVQPTGIAQPHIIAALPAIQNCRAVDGDTLRCGVERVRLIGIDSPEMPGHCRSGRACVEGDPFAAKAALSSSMSASMQIERLGTDHYGRTLALVRGPEGDLSCRQIRAGHAIYRADWDVAGKMEKACGRS